MKKVIYMHKFPDGMIYIGQSCNFKLRWGNGKPYGQKAMKDAIEKCGWENVEHIILEENVDEKDANERENYYIGKYESYKNGIGYNTLYNNKYYPKYNYIRNKAKKGEKRNKSITIRLCEKDYNYFLERATIRSMKIEKYIYMKLKEEITHLRIVDEL